MARKVSNLLASIRDSDWLNFIHFSGYKYKIRLVSILRKRKNQALISISTILKFSDMNHLKLYYCNIYLFINLIIQSELWILKSALNSKWKYLLLLKLNSKWKYLRLLKLKCQINLNWYSYESGNYLKWKTLKIRWTDILNNCCTKSKYRFKKNY